MENDLLKKIYSLREHKHSIISTHGYDRSDAQSLYDNHMQRLVADGYIPIQCEGWYCLLRLANRTPATALVLNEYEARLLVDKGLLTNADLKEMFR